MITFIKKKLTYIKLYFLKIKLQPADIIHATECQKCGYCCYHSQCSPIPEEFNQIAIYLNLSPEELLKTKFCIVTYQDIYCGEVFSEFLVIRQLTKTWLKSGKAGKILLDSDLFDASGCIFLDKNNHCLIYSVRPEEAKLMKCWEDQQKYCKPLLKWEDNSFLKDYIKRNLNVSSKRISHS